MKATDTCVSNKPNSGKAGERNSTFSKLTLKPIEKQEYQPN